MKKSLTLSTIFLLLATTHVFAQSQVDVPYFGPIKTSVLCGGAPKDCQPTNSSLYSHVAGKFYDGDVSSALAVVFTNYFDPEPLCAGAVEPTDKNTDPFNVNTFSAKVQQNKKTEFSAQLVLPFTKLVLDRLTTLPASVKADAITKFKTAVAKGIQQEFQLEYKVIQLNKNYMRDVITPCFNSLKPGQSIAVGVSVITIGGSWSSDTIKETLVAIEATAAFQSMSAKAKAEYNNQKSTMLAGSFKPFSIIFKVAYKTKPKARVG
ncbi:hypothetical protein [Hymenobacter sp. IS2118]|uniref:hypothetical protein n=1 Tax=Hymenobacter sp. IS2118 TaxID=1505605 RepID=UPI00054CFD74|nr:hypothetical protein [Hymenobacter sp. IS2118]